jgi:hypothetical protein
MTKCLILALILCLLAACGGEPSPTPDLVATQIAVELAAGATMTAWTPTVTSTPEPTETAAPTDTPTPTPVPSKTPTPRPTVTPPPHIEAEEYAVYSAMIQQNPIGYGLNSFIVIREHTMLLGSDMVERALDERPGLSAELVDSYRSRNAESYTLGPKLDLEQDYALMPREEAEKLFRRGGAEWDEFQATYPEASGVVMFSRVGFSAIEDRALVEMGFRCPGRCGAGGLYLLAKEEGSWKVIDTLVVWES